MADIEKAKELREKSQPIIKQGKILYESLRRTEENPTRVEKMFFDACCYLDQVLSALDEPVCKTCGDSKYIGPLPGSYTKDEPHAVPCPACQQPPASEFTKSFHKIINLVDPVPNSPITVENKEDKVLADWARKACDLLTAQQQQIKQLEKRLSKCISAETVIATELERDEALARLAKRDEAIK